MRLTEYISRRRTELMGCAALLIICLHAGISTGFAPWVWIVRKNGNIGVDFFVLVSGFGCVFSLKKNRDIGAYYGRRMKRLLPSHYAALALCVLAARGFPSALILAANIVPIGIWMGLGQNFWYVQASLLYYILVPLFLSMIENARFPRIAFLGLLGVFSLIVPWITQSSGAILAIMRLPALVVGVGLGVFHHSRRNKRDDWILVALVVLIWAAGFVQMRHRMIFSRAPFAFLTRSQANRLHKALRAPMILALMALALEGIERTPLRFVNAGLRAAGRYSLELYLGHSIVRFVAMQYLGLQNWALLAVMLTASWPVALLIRQGGKWLMALVDRLFIARRDSDRPSGPPA